jgi:hypothetical protein
LTRLSLPPNSWNDAFQTPDLMNGLGLREPTARRRYLAEGTLVARNAAPVTIKRPEWRIPLTVCLAMRND